MSSNLPQTFEHSEPLQTLAPHLIAHLPHSFPLLRRIQFARSQSAYALSTVPPTAGSLSSPRPSIAAAWVEGIRGPETQCWIFSSYEQTSDLDINAGFPSTRADNEAKSARLQVLALFRRIASLNIPLVNVADSNSNNSSSTIEIAPNQLIVGSVSNRLLPLLAGKETGKIPTATVLKRGQHAYQSPNADKDPKEGGEGAGSQANEAPHNDWKNVLSGLSVPYVKYLIPPPPASPATTTTTTALPPTSTPLPPHYAFTSPILQSELPLVTAATSIPRQISTLARYGSVGVRYIDPSSSSSASSLPTPAPPPSQTSRPAAAQEGAEEDTPSGLSPSPQQQQEHRDEDGDTEKAATTAAGQLIAWAFLGMDGSLSSLHVCEEHRGKGLAKAVCRRLFDMLRADPARMGFLPLSAGTGEVGAAGVEAEGERGKEIRVCGAEGWVSADVAEGNAESRGLCRAVGGEEAWRLHWMAVDLEAVVTVTDEASKSQ